MPARLYGDPCFQQTANAGQDQLAAKLRIKTEDPGVYHFQKDIS